MTVVRAGMLIPAARVSVANTTCQYHVQCFSLCSVTFSHRFRRFQPLFWSVSATTQPQAATDQSLLSYSQQVYSHFQPLMNASAKIMRMASCRSVMMGGSKNRIKMG